MPISGSFRVSDWSIHTNAALWLVPLTLNLGCYQILDSLIQSNQIRSFRLCIKISLPGSGCTNFQLFSSPSIFQVKALFLIWRGRVTTVTKQNIFPSICDRVVIFHSSCFETLQRNSKKLLSQRRVNNWKEFVEIELLTVYFHILVYSHGNNLRYFLCWGRISINAMP